MKRNILLGLVLAILLTFAGCKTAEVVEKPDYERPLPPGRHALRKITDPSMIPDLTIACYELKDMRDAI
ncbi:MAG: hypothetical protein ACYSUT_12930, partial [Planctomycetota bacterium]